MENLVDLVFTEAYIMPQKHFELLANSPKNIMVQTEENNIVKPAAAGPGNDFDFTDFPDLNQPLPDVSYREQLRLTSVNRGKVLSCQRSQQRRLMEMWHSHSAEDQFWD